MFQNKKITDFTEITLGQLISEDEFYFYLQSEDGLNDYRVAKSTLLEFIQDEAEAKQLIISLNADQIKTGNSAPIEVEDIEVEEDEYIETVSASAFMTKSGDSFDSTDIALITDTSENPQMKATFDPSLATDNTRFQVASGSNQLIAGKTLFVKFDADSDGAPNGTCVINLSYRIIKKTV